MLIYSKEPLNVMMKNILLLDDPFTQGYVYVSKETYDQALSLNITYNQDISRVKGTISGKGMLNWAANKVIGHVVSFCSERFTSPINMLAPYLAYTLPMGVEWPENDEEMVRMAYGVLHQMSQFINFYATALMPAGAKADIAIPKNIIMSYEESWKAQLETLDKCVVTIPVYVDRIVETAVPVSTSMPVASKHVEEPKVEVPVSSKSVIEEEESDEITVQPREVEEPEDIEEEDTGEEKAKIIEEETEEDSGAAEESSGEEASEESGENGDEGKEDDLEARILAMMKSIEDAPAEEFQPKDETPPVQTAPEPEKKKNDSVNYGESGSINMTEREIAEGNRRLLNDYDI